MSGGWRKHVGKVWSLFVSSAYRKQTVTVATGFPLALKDYCYDRSGAVITISIPASDKIFFDGFDGPDSGATTDIILGTIDLPLTFVARMIGAKEAQSS